MGVHITITSRMFVNSILKLEIFMSFDSITRDLSVDNFHLFYLHELSVYGIVHKQNGHLN